MIKKLKEAVRPTLVWIGFIGLTLLALAIVIGRIFWAVDVPSDAWALVAGWAALVSFMVGYYFRGREDEQQS